MKTALAFSVLAVYSIILAPVTFADGKTNIFSFDCFSQVDGLPNSQIQCILQDKKGWIWLGTNNGLFLYHPDSNLMEAVSIPLINEQSREVFEIFKDDDGLLWIGTYSNGLFVSDPEKKSVHHLSLDPYYERTETIRSISKGILGDHWIGTRGGLYVYSKTRGVTGFFRHDDRDDRSLANNSVLDILHDAQGETWIATLDKGIALYSKSEGAVKYYSEHDGLSNNQALCILEDDNNNLWISTSNGLSKFDTEKKQFRNFKSKDGLRNDQFTYGAAYKAKNGELLFGGIAGFNMFNPLDILTDDLHVPLVFTELRIFNRPVPIRDDKDAILKKSISETSHLILKYYQNVFTLEFAALDFINSTSTLYSYYLEGFDKGWNEPSIARTTTYTNLNPGDYTLRIKRILPGNPSGNEELVLNITVLPPFRMTWWFRGLIMLLIAILGYSLIRFIINREKIKNELVFERIKSRNLHELDMLKLRLFTNISHEIRTPLTLILGPLERMISRQVPDEEIPSHLALVHRNAGNYFPFREIGHFCLGRIIPTILPA